MSNVCDFMHLVLFANIWELCSNTYDDNDEDDENRVECEKMRHILNALFDCILLFTYQPAGFPKGKWHNIYSPLPHSWDVLITLSCAMRLNALTCLVKEYTYSSLGDKCIVSLTLIFYRNSHCIEILNYVQKPYGCKPKGFTILNHQPGPWRPEWRAGQWSTELESRKRKEYYNQNHELSMEDQF